MNDIKEAIFKTEKEIAGDFLHCAKELARIEKKYRARIIALTTAYWNEIDQLNHRIDRLIGGKK
jgi:hypothetical protein